MPDYDVAVLGGGPGGYIAAIRAAQLGLKTAVVERDEVGGVCLNWGCIPSKALLRNAEIVRLVRDAKAWGIKTGETSYDMGAAIDRSRGVVDKMVGGVKFLLKKHKITLHQGAGRLSAANTITIDATGEAIKAKGIIIATGARARDLPFATFDGKTIIGSREALALKQQPKSIAIIGGGAIGCEFAYFYSAYGTQVTIIEVLPHLVPTEDEEISLQLERALGRLGITIKTGSTVEKVEVKDGKAVLTLKGSGETITAEKVLLGVGVAPNSDNIGLDKLGVCVEHGFIKVDDQMATNVPGVYAIGDVTGKMMLAHVASAQGVTAAQMIAGKWPAPLDYASMPRATYCQPQIASMGLSEKAAIEQGYTVKVGKFPFAANGKAVALASTEGMVKLVTDAKRGDILGAHLIGHDVTDMLAELSMVRSLEGTALDLGKTVHAHPTLSEAVMEAGLAVSGEMPNM